MHVKSSIVDLIGRTFYVKRDNCLFIRHNFEEKNCDHNRVALL